MVEKYDGTTRRWTPDTSKVFTIWFDEQGALHYKLPDSEEYVCADVTIGRWIRTEGQRSVTRARHFDQLYGEGPAVRGPVPADLDSRGPR